MTAGIHRETLFQNKQRTNKSVVMKQTPWWWYLPLRQCHSVSFSGFPAVHILALIWHTFSFPWVYCKTHILSFWQYSSSLLEPCFSFCYLLASLYYPIKCGLDFSKCFYARFIERDWRKDLVVWILDALPEDPGSVPSTILSYHGYHD